MAVAPHKPSPISRISTALVCLTVSILALALVLGFVPDRSAAVVEGRKALCEQMAVDCSLAARRGDVECIRLSTEAAARRNPDVLSAGVRTPDGKLLVEAGEHEANWDAAAVVQSTPTHMRVPIALEEKLWGHLELRFRPLAGTAGLSGPLGQAASWLGNPALPLLGFVGGAGFVVYFVYLRVVFSRIDLAHSRLIPKRVRTALNTLAEGVVILDRDQRIAMANEAFGALVGQPAEELQGRKVGEFDWAGTPADGTDATFPWTRALGEGMAQTGTILGLQNCDNRARTLSVNAAPIIGDDGSYRGALATFDNLTTVERKNAHLRKLLQKLKNSRAEVRQQNQELKALATRDPLTGCLNRRAFFPEFETHWNAAGRYGHPLSCVMLDIDRFKLINDNHGHGVGDQVLQQVAETLKTMIRKSDLVCRYGGEEFCILLPHIDIDEAAQAAERFRHGVESRNCGNIAVTISVGVSASSLGAGALPELLEQADKALYSAKRTGRNRVVRWDEIADQVEEAPPQQPSALPPEVVAGGGSIPFHAVTALLSALAYRHADTAEHSRRVADLCVATVNRLMSQSDCYVLEVAALLHDIGKLGVPDAVLLKPGPLDPDEWKVIRTHEGIGEEIIAAAFTNPGLSAIIRNHHCWYAGSPHESDLPSKDAIPLGARVLAIADSYDAMVSDRVYRKGTTREQAFAELRRCAGVQFDPELVERFIAAVLARDESRTMPALAMSKQTALQIGVQIEKLASALDAQDLPTLAAMASHLSATAEAHGVTLIADAAARLERSATSRPDQVEITRLTIDLLDLCRATYGSYLQGPSSVAPA
jgi:diguanylate cyclase (GGDEF)-like protein/PAS domain S-box-containing protein